MIVKFSTGIIVTIFFVGEIHYIKTDMSQKIFLTILEQFLFFRIKPANNKNIVATPGFVYDADRLPSRSQTVYVYILYKNEYYFVYKSDSIAYLGFLICKNRNFVSGIISRINGVCYIVLYFTVQKLENTQINIMTESELQSLLMICKKITDPASKPVVVININSNY